MKIVERKCRGAGRSDFEIYQARYDQGIKLYLGIKVDDALEMGEWIEF